MWEPVGPLPASVYWKRRFTAVAGAVAALIVLAWSVAAAFAPPADPTPAVGPASVSAPQLAIPQPVDPTPAPVEPIPPVVSADGAPSTTSEVLLPDDSPRAPVPVPPTEPVPPTGPVDCTNDMLSVLAEAATPEHRVGERPVLRLVVVNVSEQACVRDLDSARQEVVVWSGDGVDRLWSSNDCVNASTVDLRTMVPGRPVVFTVAWAGRTSAPGCAEERTEVPAGAYRVMTRVDDLISAPTPILRNEAAI